MYYKYREVYYLMTDGNCDYSVVSPQAPPPFRDPVKN